VLIEGGRRPPVYTEEDEIEDDEFAEDGTGSEKGDDEDS
jgi:hypothetical protein